MKKLSLLFTCLFIIGCNNQINTELLDNSASISSNIKLDNPLTSKIAYPLALKKIKTIFSKPILFEIDVWNESAGNSINFGFMQKNKNNQYDFMRVIINPDNGKITQEEIPDSGKIPNPVNIDNWKLDNNQILEISRNNGLKDETFLATLWENTWHISGLKQDLYFQINSKNGEIQMICTGPYMNNCTDASNNPITLKSSLDFKNKKSNIK